MKIRKAAALKSNTNSVDERIESRSKKHRVSKENPQIDDAPENSELAMVVYESYDVVIDAEPISCFKESKSCKPRKHREKIQNGPNPSPEIPIEFKNMIETLGGTELRMIIQKGLNSTDLNKSQCRLSMPSSLWSTADQALASELSNMFETELQSNGKNYVSVPLIDTKREYWESVNLTKWKMNKAMVVISGKWNEIVAKNDLKIKDVIQIWCFKFETGMFGLAMVKIEDGCNNESNDNDDVSSSESHIAASSCVLAPASTGSSNSSITYFDFMNTGCIGAMTDSDGSDQERVVTDQIDGSEPCDDDGSNGLGGSLNEAALLAITDDVSSYDIDLTLHL